MVYLLDIIFVFIADKRDFGLKLTLVVGRLMTPAHLFCLLCLLYLLLYCFPEVAEVVLG